ncbi:hypothetical protein EGT07_04600 [Herbaspirillum sp. HC18]|nr:hypothetical protein EGT07_04600 [Herbaspirillum sp. HC18]
MNMQIKSETDMTVRSFAYVAKQLAQSPSAASPSALYAQILGEAEKHRSALRLAQRDVLETAEQELRKHTLTKSECQQWLETVYQVVAQAQQAISRIVAQYAPHKLAA